MSTSQNCCCHCLCPHSELQPPPASAGDPPILAGMSCPVPYGVTAFLHWVLVHTRPSVSPPRVEFLFPPVLWNSCDQTLLTFKVRVPGGSSSFCQTPQFGKLDMGLRIFTPLGELLWYNYFPVCGLPTQWVWDFILS